METAEAAGLSLKTSNFARHGEEAWAAKSAHAFSHLRRNHSMAELREAHLRYLLAIYELGKSTPDVGTQAIAKALNCSKASVTKMMATLMDMNLLVRERYGKIYLTDTGYLLAKDMFQCVELIHERLPAMGFDLTEEEAQDFVRTMVVNLPEHCRRRLAGRM